MFEDLGGLHASAEQERKRLIEFRLRGFPKARNVYLVSRLSTWVPGAYPMRREGEVWILRLSLPPGDFGYLFAIDGCRWRLDPDNPRTGPVPFPWLPVKRCSVAFISEEEAAGEQSAQRPVGIENALPDHALRALSTRASPAEAQTPSWAQGTVFYHVLVDRFRNGDPKNDPPGASSWGSPATRDPHQSFGGDLQGVIDRLEYLQELGVDALYLTPVFRSRTWHKYDTEDYYAVDPAFGDASQLVSLVRAAHQKSMRVILDGTFAYTGVGFFAFQDLLENQRRSRYADWYFVRRFPVRVGENRLLQWLFARPLLYRHFRLRAALRARFPLAYETFLDAAPSMPKVNLLDPEASEYFLRVAEHWTREADLDGWRLDSALCVPPEFWERFCERVRSVRPDAYLIGEVECEPGGAADFANWARPGLFDAVMNYWLRAMIVDFAVEGKIGPRQLAARLAEYQARVPPHALHAMYNVLSTTETPRLATLCAGDARKARLAFFLLMTLPGAPVICYGDEIGLEGGERYSTNRSTMKWDPAEWNQELRDYVQALVRLRKAHRALRVGDFRATLADDEMGVLAFERRAGNQIVLAVLNHGNKPASVLLPAELLQRAVLVLGKGGLRTRDGNSMLEVPPETGLVAEIRQGEQYSK